MTIETLPNASPPERDKFSLEKCFSVGWNGMKTYFMPLLLIVFFSGILMTIGAIPSVISFLSTVIPSLKHPMIQVLTHIFSFLVAISISPFVELGMLKVSLCCVDGKAPTVKDFMPTWSQFWKFVVASFVFNLAKGFGYLLFIFPGIFIDMTFHFYGYLIADKKMGPIKALEASRSMTRGILISIFITEIAILAVKAVGGMVFLVGFLPAMMIASLARASMYRQIVSNVEAEEFALNGQSEFSLPEDSAGADSIDAPPSHS